MYSKKYLPVLFTVTLFSCLVFFSSCANKDKDTESEEGQEEVIYEKQTKIDQDAMENLESTQESIEETLDEMAALEDSLNQTQEMIAEKQEEIKNEENKLEKEASELESERLKLVEERQREDLRRLNFKLDSLSGLVAQKQQQLESVEKDSAMVISNRDSLEQQGKLISNLDTEMANRIETGIAEIDNKLEELKDEKLSYQERIELSQRKMDIARRKRELLRDEREIYEGERQDELNDGALESDVDDLNNIIEGLDQEIESQSQKIAQAQSNVSSYQESINRIDRQRKNLSEQIRKNHTTKQIIDEFMADEQSRLESELAKLDTIQQQQIDEKKAIAREKQVLEKELANLKQKSTEIESSELTKLAERRAEIEKEISELEQEEEDLEAEMSQEPAGEEMASADYTEVEELAQKYEALQTKLAAERAALANERKELAVQREEVARVEAEERKNVSYIIYGIIALIVLALAGLYVYGKRRNKTS